MYTVLLGETQIDRCIAADLEGAAYTAVPESDHLITTRITVSEADAEMQTGITRGRCHEVPPQRIIASAFHTDTHTGMDAHTGNVCDTGFGAQIETAAECDSVGALLEVQQ